MKRAGDTYLPDGNGLTSSASTVPSCFLITKIFRFFKIALLIALCLTPNNSAVLCCPSSVANLVNGTLSIVSPFLTIITASDKIVNTCGDW